MTRQPAKLSVQTNPAISRPGPTAPILVLVTLVAMMFIDVLLAGGNVLLARPDSDMSGFFYPVRDWGFDQLRQGRIPLWNPHISCGTPFLGDAQTGLLYPLNWPALYMSTAAGINWTIAVHILLAGLLMYLWVRHHGVSRLAGILAGSIYMFCGAYFFKILASHLTFICAGAWVPLVLWSVDRIFATGQVRWSLIGGLGAAMQILAGGSQYAFYTGLAAALYALFNLTRHRDRWLPVLGGGLVMALLAVLLSAGQIIPALAATAESTRADGFDFAAAARGDMRPLVFLTLLCPYLFGHTDFSVFRDLWGIHQLQMNVGAVGLMLTCYSIVCVESRRRRFGLTLIVILCLIALGHYTPVFRFLYEHVPPFREFRVVARIGLFANAFMALLAALALDKLRSAELRPWLLAACCMALGMGMAVLAVSMHHTRRGAHGGTYGAMMEALDPSHMLYRGAMAHSDRPTREKARLTARMLGVSGAGFLLGGAALLLWRHPHVRVYALATIAVAELFVSARVSRVSAPLSEVFKVPGEWQVAIDRVQPTERTFHARASTRNQTMLNRAFDANGYEAIVLRRFAQMGTLTIRDTTHTAENTAPLENLPGICQLMRIRYILADKPPRTIEMPRPMDRVELLDRCRVLPGMPAVFNVMNDPAFDPRRAVLLESEPDIQPQPGGAAGSASVTRYDSDEIEIVADVPKPAILLITEAYSADWHVTPLPDSSQKQYTFMPADLLVRAIPLAAGKHHIHLEYRPPHYALGLWISGITATACLAGLAVWVCFGFRSRRQPAKV
jgi:hypothetical protein